MTADPTNNAVVHRVEVEEHPLRPGMAYLNLVDGWGDSFHLMSTEQANALQAAWEHGVNMEEDT